MAFFLFSTLDSQTFSPSDSALLFAVFWPKALVLMVIASGLLLRLLEAHQKEKREDEHVG